MAASGVVKGGAREGAGAKPLPPEQKMVAYKISATPADWEYLGLFLPADVSPAQRTPGHLFRAGLERLRLHCPNGPDKPFYVPDPAAPKKPRLTPSVARYAARQGISRAEAMNRAWAVFEASEEVAKQEG